MKWLGGRESTNVDDRRGLSAGGIVAGGGVIGLIVYLVNLFLGGGDPSQPLPQPPQQQQEMSAGEKKADDQLASFVKVTLGYTEDVWTDIFSKQGKQYKEPVLVFFRDQVESACGIAGAASGPFYCPSDQRVYIDLSFYQELKNRFNAPGDFAMAYVIAHEVGHHVQRLLGIMDSGGDLIGRSDEAAKNKHSVMVELQADFLAGVWAHHAQEMKNILDQNDIGEALAAAGAIGDDQLQKQSQGYVVPESFTHGTSKQRIYWFKKGFETGDISQGDTFHDQSLQ